MQYGPVGCSHCTRDCSSNLVRGALADDNCCMLSRSSIPRPSVQGGSSYCITRLWEAPLLLLLPAAPPHSPWQGVQVSHSCCKPARRSTRSRCGPASCSCGTKAPPGTRRRRACEVREPTHSQPVRQLGVSVVEV